MSWCAAHVHVSCMSRKAQKTNTSGMPPAEWGLRGWMCVYRSVLAGRGRDPVQNNGTAVECGTAGNILSQTQGNPGVWGGAHCGRTFLNYIVMLNRWHQHHSLVRLTTYQGSLQLFFLLLLLHHNQIRRPCPMEYLSNLWLIHWKSLSKCESLNCGGVEVTVNMKC